MLLQGPDPAVIAPMVVTIVIAVTTGAVLIFRPLTKRLGDRLAASKQPPTVIRADEAELAHMHQALEETNARLEQLEQRLDFTERLLAKPREAAIAPGQALPGQAGQPPRS